jgi:hypothetical protein
LANLQLSICSALSAYGGGGDRMHKLDEEIDIHHLVPPDPRGKGALILTQIER